MKRIITALRDHVRISCYHVCVHLTENWADLLGLLVMIAAIILLLVGTEVKVENGQKYREPKWSIVWRTKE